jgi:hypothetical protein
VSDGDGICPRLPPSLDTPPATRTTTGSPPAPVPNPPSTSPAHPPCRQLARADVPLHPGARPALPVRARPAAQPVRGADPRTIGRLGGAVSDAGRVRKTA